MKITFFISDWGGCGYYRCVVPAQYLIRNGTPFQIQSIYNQEHIDESDIIVMQRQFDEKVLPWQQFAKERGKKIVFECDDDIFNVPDWNPTKKHWDLVSKTAQTLIANSDLVTVTNDALKRSFSRFNPNIEILPNSIDFKVVSQLEERDLFLQVVELYHQTLQRKPLPLSKILSEKENGTVNIGWAGSFTHKEDLPILEEVLPVICKKNPNVMIYMVGYTLKEIIQRVPKNQLRLIEGVDTPKYLGLLRALRLDIGLCPIKRHIFNEGKSNLKALEYLSMKIVPVATDFGSYSETLENYKNGFLCSDDPENWIAVIQKLIDSKTLRQNVAEDGYNLVKSKFNIEVTWKKWFDVYSNLLNGTSNPL